MFPWSRKVGGRFHVLTLSASGHERRATDGRRSVRREEKFDYSAGIARFGVILKMQGPLVEIGPRSVFGISAVGGWQ